MAAERPAPAEGSVPGEAAKKGAKQGAKQGAKVRSHSERLIETLEVIIGSGKAKTTADLIKYTLQAGEREGAEYLKELEVASIPIDLAFEALRVHVRIIAFLRGNALIAACEGKKVGLVLPLPPHVAAAFDHLEHLAFLVPDGLHLPPWLEGGAHAMSEGTRASRDLVNCVIEPHWDGGSRLRLRLRLRLVTGDGG